MINRDSWPRYFMKLAELVATRSEDLSTHVGCVIVGPDKEVRSTGYNGFPRGVEATEERLQRPAKYSWTAHAEINAVGNAARSGVSLKGCTAYVTHACCDDCTRLLIQAGIREVVFGEGAATMPIGSDISLLMFKEAGVAVGIMP